MLRLLCTLPMLAGGTVLAADWDHDANIDGAVVELVSTYRLGGLAAMERLVDGCYALMAQKPDADERLKQLEYCATMDFAAYRLDHIDTPDTQHTAESFFAIDQLVGRMGRLSEFITDPNVGNQVVRAWARSSADALERIGY